MPNQNDLSNTLTKGLAQLVALGKVSLLDFIIGIGIAFLLGLFIYYIYKKSFRGVVYSHSYNITLVSMVMITCLIIMTISTNIVLSLGMVGALSIVRFRTAIKDPIDIIFMFWAIAAGIATGARVFPIAIIGSLFVGVVIFFLAKRPFKDTAYLLVVHYQEEASDMVKSQLSKIKHILKAKTVRKGIIEMTVEVKVIGENTAFVNLLSEVEGVLDVALVSYTGDYAP
jgi:uncharacterized membrane protein YhiD involved in acid resistance